MRIAEMMDLASLRIALLLLLTLLFAPGLHARAVAVEVVQTAGGNWQLLRGGQPYYIMGAGGEGSKELLAAAGANTFRTWGVEPGLGEQLDRAHSLGLTVIVGHWLGHERHGFDYRDEVMVADQIARVRRDVLNYKDHPAVLIWGLGNEMEGIGAGDDPAIWNHIQELAAMVKELDPFHPTMIVTADIGGKRVESVHKLCPDIDILGINTYGGLPSLPRRYRELGGTTPYLVTEFGPPGAWETSRTEFGAPLEPSSTQKAGLYRDFFQQGCLAEPLCLGGCAFLWGSKPEATATWFGMLLPNGEKLAAVDAMTEVWRGKPPANLCPEVISFQFSGPTVLQAGQSV
ncbi:MAG: glycoside hydrolase family 2 TIM barrel-domain containing protein, partial [Candidatus Syntrophosphaera sp.]